MTASTTCLVGCTLSVSFCLEASVNFMEPLSEEQAVHGECIQQLENLVRQVGPGWEVKVGNSVEGVSRKDQKSTACHGLFPVGFCIGCLLCSSDPCARHLEVRPTDFFLEGQILM